jgi:hypothetical protein
MIVIDTGTVFGGPPIGTNTTGQLGDNTITSKSSPVQTIMYGTNWQKTTGKVYNTAAIQYQDDYQ